MVSEGKKAWLVLIPGAVLFLLVLAINLMGDGLRDVTAPKDGLTHDRCASFRKNLTLNIPTGGGTLHAVRGVILISNAARPFPSLASGSGKPHNLVMGLLGKSIKLQADEMRFDNVDLQTANRRVMRDLRGNQIAMIFQEPMTSLNPAYTIGDQLTETLLLHRKVSKSVARARAIELLGRHHCRRKSPVAISAPIVWRLAATGDDRLGLM